jgi:hypothetical protein
MTAQTIEKEIFGGSDGTTLGTGGLSSSLSFVYLVANFGKKYLAKKTNIC